MIASAIAGGILLLYGFVCIGTLIEMITEGSKAARAKKEWDDHQKKLPPFKK